MGHFLCIRPCVLCAATKVIEICMLIVSFRARAGHLSFVDLFFPYIDVASHVFVVSVLCMFKKTVIRGRPPLQMRHCVDVCLWHDFTHVLGGPSDAFRRLSGAKQHVKRPVCRQWLHCTLRTPACECHNFRSNAQNSRQRREQPYIGVVMPFSRSANQSVAALIGMIGFFMTDSIRSATATNDKFVPHWTMQSISSPSISRICLSHISSVT